MQRLVQWNPYNCCFLVSLKEKTVRVENYQKTVTEMPIL